MLKPRPGAKNQSTMFPAQNGGIPGPSPLMKAAFAAAKKMGADTRGETMADATNYVLANKLYWTCAKTGRVFERVGKAPPTLCELCGAENHVESGHCRRASVEEFMAFVRELRVVATAKTYPENECPGCGRGEEVWESARFPEFMRHHKPSQMVRLKFIPPDQVEAYRRCRYEG